MCGPDWCCVGPFGFVRVCLGLFSLCGCGWWLCLGLVECGWVGVGLVRFVCVWLERVWVCVLLCLVVVWVWVLFD